MMKSSFRESSIETTNNLAERRTIIAERQNGSFGFTLQSYGIHYRQSSDLEIITYVDFVDPNGCAQKAGLKSGDVIVSINGQEVERVDHATLVAIIQSCPDRIRMVVVFENCVRKVELHMKYIRLKRMLEAKAREYQEVCFSEKSFIARLNKTRGPGSYHTIQSSHVVMRRQQQQAAPQSIAPPPSVPTYSSKSMPRSQSHHHPEVFRQYSYTPTTAVASSATTDSSAAECCNKRRSSYLQCISQPTTTDCTCCFRKDEERNTTPVRQQRPRSFYLPNCYNPNVESPVADEQYLIRPNHKAYGGYGFGYDYPVQRSPHHRAPSVSAAAAAAAAASSTNLKKHYRRSQSQMTNDNKSTEDLLLADRMQNQCYIPPNYHPPNLESIAFYKRPSLPVSSPSIAHYQQHRNYQRRLTADEEGPPPFNQVRSSREGTLPKQKTTE